MSLQTNDITVDKAYYVRQLQTALRAIQRSRNGFTNVPPDGIYGTETTQAVADFQQTAGLPVTGATDRATWNAILEAARELQYADTLPTPIQAYRSPSQFLQIGDSGDGVAFLQIMLRRLQLRFPNLLPVREVNGLYTEETAAAVRVLQGLTGLPQTGLTDKPTWDAITALYNEG